MKYLKKFENIFDTFKSKNKIEDDQNYYDEYDSRVGDYFIVTDTNTGQYSDEFDRFLDSHIGKIIKIDKSVSYNMKPIPTRYETKIPFIHGEFIFNSNDTDYFKRIHDFRIDHIKSSPNIEDLEAILQAKKYNL